LLASPPDVVKEFLATRKGAPMKPEETTNPIPLYFKALISQFDGIRPEPLDVCPTIEQAIDYIKTDQRLKSDVETARKYLRQELQENERDEKGKLKLPEYNNAKEHLPAVTWSGTFKKRTNTGLLSFSGFLSFDIDLIDKKSQEALNYDELRDKARQAYKALSHDKYTAFLFPSVSATGIKGLVEIPPILSDIQYKEYFRAYKIYASQTLKQVLDSLPDVSRLCFLAPCDNPYINRDALVFEQRAKERPQEPQEIAPGQKKDDVSLRAALAVFLRYGIQRELSRNDFVGICGAFKRGGVAYDIFDAIMKRTAGYDAKNNFKIWNTVDITAPINNPMTIATIISWAREQDKELFRAARKELIAQEGEPIDGTMGLAELIEKKLASKYGFSLNKVTDQILVSTQKETRQMSKFVEAEIRCWLTNQGFTRKDTISDVLNVVAFKSEFHPIEDYLKSLKWDGECHFSKIGTYFKDPDRIFAEILKSWMCGAVRRVFTGQHHQVIVFVGKQGRGKSFFAKWLCSAIPEYGMESQINPDSNDSGIRACENFIWEIGELGGTTRRADIDALKFFISREFFKFRRAHDKYDVTKRALASFVGTVNPDGTGFLNDPTGHRRWWPVELTDINFDYVNNLDVNQLWAQAVMLFRESQTECDILPKTQETINKNIENDFVMSDPVEEMIIKLFDFTGQENDFIDTNDILIAMARNGYQRNKQRADSMEVARAIKHLQDDGAEIRKSRESGLQRRRGYAGLRIKPAYSGRGEQW
jgi:predicted P-loop ATPase